jgi:hypothetical protein
MNTSEDSKKIPLYQYRSRNIGTLPVHTTELIYNDTIGIDLGLIVGHRGSENCSKVEIWSYPKSKSYLDGVYLSYYLSNKDTLFLFIHETGRLRCLCNDSQQGYQVMMDFAFQNSGKLHYDERHLILREYWSKDEILTVRFLNAVQDMFNDTELTNI